MTEKDKEYLGTLIDALILSGIKFNHKKINKNTKSLYRFGTFEIEGYNYVIVSWSFIKSIVTFENTDSLSKIKFSINDKKIISGEFEKMTKIVKYKKYLKNKLADILKELSDKLRN